MHMCMPQITKMHNNATPLSCVGLQRLPLDGLSGQIVRLHLAVGYVRAHGGGRGRYAEGRSATRCSGERAVHM